MFYLKLLFFVLGHIILLPIKLLIQVLEKWILWNPTMKFDPMTLEQSGEIQQKYEYCLENTNELTIAEDGDGPKWMGILSKSTGSDCNWEILKRYWWDTGYFVRTIDPAQVSGNSPNFSGDQMAGMIPAIWERLKTKGLSENEKKVLGKIFHKTVFEDRFLMFKHPFVKSPDRGYICSFWSMAPSWLSAMVFFDLAYKVTGNIQYKRLYQLFRIVGWPMNWLGEHGIFMGKVYFLTWYDEHSKMMLYHTGWEMTNDKGFKIAAKHIYNRHWYNPDIAGMWYKISGSTEAKETMISWLKDYNIETRENGGIESPEEWITKYYSIKGFKSKKKSVFILPTRFRNGNYNWETDPMRPDTDPRKGWFIDFIHLYNLNN